jgi:hypothetical protein
MSMNHTAPALGLVALAALAATALPATSASAVVLDTDRVKLAEDRHDFGLKQLQGGDPVKGGHLRWDLTGGVTTPELTGFHFVSRGECGRLRVKYYDATHTQLGSRRTNVHCAPSNAITRWKVDIDNFSSTTVTHVHVDLQKMRPNGTFKTLATALEDFN